MPIRRFIETHVFTARIQEHIGDESYRALQVSLLLRPDQGRVVPGTRGLRKLRWPGEGKGKRGGLRVIYYWIPSSQTCYMLFAYSKAEQGDLTAAQARALSKLVEEELG